MNRPTDILQLADGLIVVDVQKDFCPGGALAIPSGDEVVPILNRWIEAAIAKNVPIYISRDWHPVNHISFEQRGGRWPPHCIQDSDGASFHPNLSVPPTAIKVTKGVRLDKDQNSAFDETGLANQLRYDGVKRVFVGGLAEDVCVLASVLEGCQQGFDVVVIEDATRPVTIEGGEQARKKMLAAGARVVQTD